MSTGNGPIGPDRLFRGEEVREQLDFELQDLVPVFSDDPPGLRLDLGARIDLDDAGLDRVNLGRLGESGRGKKYRESREESGAHGPHYEVGSRFHAEPSWPNAKRSGWRISARISSVSARRGPGRLKYWLASAR